jgi:S-DNA-T family DNA segregation ATPase FtsK/SpoIIIE
VPNVVPQIVPMKAVILSEKFQNTHNMALPVAIGKTISNEVYIFDLAKMPHVLMAGATGQGKSVGLNAILTSLLYKKHPAELKFVLVDPKRVELTNYSKIERHYLAKLPDAESAIITDTKKVVNTLNSLCKEMDNRYELLERAKCRNLVEYNEKFKTRRLNPEKGHRFLPYIVLIFDEFADCILTAGREIETPIARLAQLARAIGIHLIIATQRPSVNVITGLIKANFPARIAFKVASKIDSRTILDGGGAENLIGKGDMLISTGSTTTRVQCALVDTPETDRICDYIGEQYGYVGALMLPEVAEELTEGGSQEVDDKSFDPAFVEAARTVVNQQQGSTSLLQRKLELGYNRAGRIMDQLEREKIVGCSNGSKPREVLIKDMNTLEELFRAKNLR